VVGWVGGRRGGGGWCVLELCQNMNLEMGDSVMGFYNTKSSKS